MRPGHQRPDRLRAREHRPRRPGRRRTSDRGRVYRLNTASASSSRTPPPTARALAAITSAVEVLDYTGATAACHALPSACGDKRSTSAGSTRSTSLSASSARRSTCGRTKIQPLVASTSGPMTSATSSQYFCPSYEARPIMSAARSAMASTVAFGLALGIVGITDASATRRPATPRTRSRRSTTASVSDPSRQVPTGW
jgi:hypothetical protein